MKHLLLLIVAVALLVTPVAAEDTSSGGILEAIIDFFTWWIPESEPAGPVTLLSEGDAPETIPGTNITAAPTVEPTTTPGENVTATPTPALTPRILGTVYAVDYHTSPPYGSAPFMVRFTAANETDIEYTHWQFGDGYSSTERDHWHTYAEPGTYTVTLTATNAYGEDSETKISYISVSAPSPLPSASFTMNVTSGDPPLAVQFTDTSSGDITSWSWNFGDGETSTEQHPAHTYTARGTYSVSLTVSGPTGEDTETGSIFARSMRPKASSPIATLDESPYTSFVGAFGGNNQLNETTEGVDWLGMKDAAERPYTDLIGPFFYVIVFAIPFLMQWLRQGSMAVPAAIGIILGGIMLAKTPAEYHLAAIAFIALSILAVVWGVIKDRN